MPMRRDDLAGLDRALLRLRRMWDAPAGIEHEGQVVEGSTLLVCLAVEEHGSATEVGVVEVAAALGVRHSTASRLAARAVDVGMVARQPSVNDPRRVSLTLTAAGRRLVSASRAFRTARLDAALADWTAEDLGRLTALLTRFAADVTNAPPPGAG